LTGQDRSVGSVSIVGGYREGVGFAYPRSLILYGTCRLSGSGAIILFPSTLPALSLWLFIVVFSSECWFSFVLLLISFVLIYYCFNNYFLKFIFNFNILKYQKILKKLNFNKKTS
jgi:hypothetical protein